MEQVHGGQPPSASAPPPSPPPPPPPLHLCVKCKQQPIENNLRAYPNTCTSCLEAAVAHKVRLGIRSKGGVVAGDRVAIAYSGGPASSLLLYLIEHHIRNERAGRWDKVHVPFHLTVMYVSMDDDVDADDESGDKKKKKKVVEEAVMAMTRQDERNASSPLEVVCVSVADMYDQPHHPHPHPGNKNALISTTVKDATGRADLKRHLMLRRILDECKHRKCSKLLWAVTHPKLAVNAIADMVKGGGYAVPGGASRIDRRHARYGGGPVVVQPMKDLGYEEIDILVAARGIPVPFSRDIKTVQESDINNDINGLSARFVSTILRHNPGAVGNINSTVSRLAAFAWNADEHATTKRSGAGEGEKDTDTEEENEVLCPLCYAPLADDEILACVRKWDDLGTNPSVKCVCDGCLHEIFGKEWDAVFALLPGCVQADILEGQRRWSAVREDKGASGDARELRSLYHR